jgi:class 3 adenylate cyclase/tetratricopeptide (TPR) repeat protein
MKCSQCQHDNETGAKFCEECAAPLARTCANCGRQLTATAKFCPECAHPAGSAPAPPTSPRFTSPESYTPKHLAERILSSRAALEGERKQVTVLFADLKGSMELLADRDPEDARRLLDPVLERMMEAVHRYEGTVNQVMGDGIMALFGAPLAHEDHAVRACYAALDMHAAMRRWAEEARRAHGLSVEIRVGLNSGQVVVRAIGSDLHMDYTAVGQSTHLAARMEQLATGGTSYLTADTLRLAEGYIEVKSLGRVPVKGLEAPVEVFELTGAGPLRSRLLAAAARGLTRFVGRAGELEQLRLALGRVAGGQGQVVALVGEPGVGKSRLIWEVTHSHRIHGWLVLQAGSVSYGKTTSYLPVVDLLKGYFAIDDRDSPRAVREKVTGKLLTLDRALEGNLPALLALLDVPSDDPQWATLDPPNRRRRTLDAVRRLVLRESQTQPVLVVVEDLHWIDSETQTLLDGLVESLPATRLLLVVNYRPEYQHPWGSRTYYTQLRLDPLPSESAEELLGALLGIDVGLDPLKRLLIARTEGNPFFLEESVRALVETGALSGERGAYRQARALPTVDVPATVQAVLAARIDRLGSGDKTLLQTASVIGKDVPFALLQAIAESADSELHATLGRLRAAEFLYEARIFPDVEYTFKHALTHDVAYGSLLQDRRRTLDGRIVEALERLYPDRLVEHVETLAHHAFRGELWDKAVIYLRQAGAKAFARSANREASAYFEQALAALTRLPEARDTREQGIDVRLALRNSLWPLGRHEPAFRHLCEAERLAQALGDQRRLGWIAAYLSEHARMTGYAGDAPALAERAHAIADGLDDLPLRIAATYYLGTAYFVAGDYRRTDEFFARILQLLDGDRVRERYGLAGLPSVMARFFWTSALIERGEFARAMVQAQDGIELAEVLDHPYSLTHALLAFGRLHGARGDLGQAIRLTERGFALSHEWSLTQLSPMVGDVLGYFYALSGRIAEGVALLEEALRAMDAMAMVQWRAPLIARLVEAYLLADRPGDALTLMERGLTLSRQHGHRGSEAWAHRLLGEIASHRDRRDVPTAEAHYDAGLTLASDLGMRPLVAHCHLGLGKLYRRTGQRQAALEHLTTATTMYRIMGMGLWPEQAEAEIGELS